jgi:RimJ/RimL family protein N-acetyltransferase
MLGEIRLDALDEHDRRARLAVGLYDPAKLGMGLGREAIRLVLKRLPRASLAPDRPSRCCLQHPGNPMLFCMGFVEEGREREAALVASEWHDDVIMGLLSREVRCFAS